jgi:serine/threonine protein kinase
MLFDKGKKYCGRRIGDYRIIGRIGEGRYGVCFLAEKNGERVILKKVKPHIFHWNKRNNPCEIQILSQLHHPGIPRLLGVVDEKGFYGLVLEQKSGDTIEQLLFKHKHGFTNPEILIIGSQLIGIIKYLHSEGIVHRDIRIPNVLLDGDTISLVDFGLARWVDHKRYTKDIDFSYLGDFLLYLLYSTYRKVNHRSRPWYEELPLTSGQKLLLKRLLKIAPPYSDAALVAEDFQKAFSYGKEV